MRFDGYQKRKCFFFTIPTAGTCKFGDGNELVYDSEKIVPGCTDIVAEKMKLRPKDQGKKKGHLRDTPS